MSNRIFLVVTLVVFIGLLSASASMVHAQYGYSTPTPTVTSPATTPAPTATSTPVPTATSSGTNLVLYEGPLTTGATSSIFYGFGDTATSITSPGPTLKLIEGTTYTMTVYNVDPSMAHSWEIVSSKAVGTPLFSAGIDVNTYIPAGTSASVTFTPNQTGNFYYVCTRPGHIGYGMYGNVVVTSATTSPAPTTPEFPLPTTALLAMLAVAAASAVIARKKKHRKT